MNITPLQRRTLEYLATVDSATPAEIVLCPNPRASRELMARLITAGHATNISTTRRCVYRITLQGRQAIAPPLVCVAWWNGQSGWLKPDTAKALMARLNAEMGPVSHWIFAG